MKPKDLPFEAGLRGAVLGLRPPLPALTAGGFRSLSLACSAGSDDMAFGF